MLYLSMQNNSMKPFKHQIVAVERFINSEYVHALYWDVGTAKTRAALMCYQYAKHIGKAEQLLVLAPISIINKAWGEDIEKFTELQYTDLHKKKTPDNEVCIINLESFISNKKHSIILDWIKERPTMCVIDESQKIKGFRTISTKKVLAARNMFTAKMVLSGTPAPNDESEYWAQMVFLNDAIFPTNFFAFRHKYFCLARGSFSMASTAGLSKSELGQLMKKGFKYRLLDQNHEKFYQCMTPYISWIKKDDVLDLPGEIDETLTVELGKEQRKRYNEMKYQLVTEIQGQDVVATIALAKMTRLRQITSGFSKSDTGEIVVLKENPKLKVFNDTIESIGSHQVMIFAEYHKEIDDIKASLGNSAGVLDGRTVNKEEVITAFKNKELQYLICHPKSGGVGLSFNDCDYTIFYSLSFSSENYEQCRGRTVRALKKNKATFIHLIAENTTDELMYDVVKKKIDKMNIIERFINA